MIASSDAKLRNPPSSLSSKASIRPLERPGSKGRDSSRSRPSTSSSGKSSRSRDERKHVQGTGDLTAHVKSTLAALETQRREPRERTASRSVLHKTSNRPPAPVKAASAGTSPSVRGRPLASSSSWSNLRFHPKSSKDSLKEDLHNVTSVPNNVGNAEPPTLRRFQSLGFLRRRRSSTSTQSQSITSLASQSSHGHSTTDSNSSNGPHSHQQQRQPQGQASQPSPPNRSHSVSASTVFPSLSRSSTFALTVTTGPSISSTNNPPPVSIARPPKANPAFRRSVSLYEKNDAPKSTPTESTPLLPRRTSSLKRVTPMPPTKTRTVARTPCTYDVTTNRPARPRSSSLPLDPALKAAIASTSQSSSRSEDKHTRSCHFSEAKEAQTIKAHGARRISCTRPLNTSSSLTDLSSSYTLTPMTPRPQGTSGTATPRAHNRYAAVYRPPPPLDADGYARAGHPKPALSLSMPNGRSIIESLPLSDTLLPPSVSVTAADGIPSRTASPSSSYARPFCSSLTSSPIASPRPPPRAAIPESPGASPETRSKLLPTLPLISDSLTVASPPTVTSPLRTNAGLAPWARQRAHSTARILNMPSSWTGDERPTSLATHNYLPNSNAIDSGPNPTSDSAKNAASNKINYAQGGRLGTSNTRTVYINTPTIPISNQRRPSLPITPTASEFSIASTQTDESLWVYFEQSGLASASSQNSELSQSRGANTLSQTSSQGNHNRTSIYEATLDSSASTTPLSTPRSRGRGLSVNMGKSVHTMYAASPSGSGSHTPQTPASSSSLQTPPLTSSASPSSPYTHRKPLATSPAPRIDHSASSSSPANTIKLSSAHTIILREPPSTRPQRAQRPTHLTSYSLPSPKVDASFTISDPPAHSQVLYLDPARSYAGLNIDSPSAFFNSPYPSPGVTFPVTPMTPLTPWMGSGKNGDGDADSLVLPPSPRRY